MDLTVSVLFLDRMILPIVVQYLLKVSLDALIPRGLLEKRLKAVSQVCVRPISDAVAIPVNLVDRMLSMSCEVELNSAIAGWNIIRAHQRLAIARPVEWRTLFEPLLQQMATG
jgi:hypothetical protein